ncbi:MAG: 2-amino-4-hydroxy-6-hydroxymethyldihydropteridine diphosphokinase [Alphaproteobacteria bacterium]|nr:MAG: 2-amino-4-hydroxy-6-hydroxymethyldihydropteridine diphosphokinase [Alphaproteobacteria bacterium]
MATTNYAIALGSNRRSRHGSPAETLRAALGELEPVAVSTIRATPALGPAGRSFANAVAIVESDLLPDALLAVFKGMERAFGRRPGKAWGPRVLDLDIILWSEGPWGGPGPIVPHPAFRGRSFVLSPLAELAPDWRDPVTGLAVRHLLARLTAPRPAHRG